MKRGEIDLGEEEIPPLLIRKSRLGWEREFSNVFWVLRGGGILK